jgi:hypothetical protein
MSSIYLILKGTAVTVRFLVFSNPFFAKWEVFSKFVRRRIFWNMWLDAVWDRKNDSAVTNNYPPIIALFLFVFPVCASAMTFNCGYTTTEEGYDAEVCTGNYCPRQPRAGWSIVRIPLPLNIDPEGTCKYVKGPGPDIRHDGVGTGTYYFNGAYQCNCIQQYWWKESEVCTECPNPPTGGGCGDLSCPEGTVMTQSCSCVCAQSPPEHMVPVMPGSCDFTCRPVRVSEDLFVNSTCENGFFTYAFSFGFMYMDTNEPPGYYPHSTDVQMYKGKSCIKDGGAYDCLSWGSFSSGESGTWWYDLPDGVYKWHVRIVNSCGQPVAEYDRFYDHQCDCACSDPTPGGPPVF